MLRTIAPEFKRKGYVLTNQNGQVLAGKSGVAGGESSSRFARDVRQAGDLTTVLDRLRAASTESPPTGDARWRDPHILAA